MQKEVCVVPADIESEFIDIYKSAEGSLKDLEYVVTALRKFYNNYSSAYPCAFKVLVGEIMVRVPTEILSELTDIVCAEFKVTPKEMEVYVQQRINLILAEPRKNIAEGKTKLFAEEATKMFRTAIDLDGRKRANANDLSWVNIIYYRSLMN